MLTLDLTNEEKSDIKYKTINYPDGQRDLIINKESCHSIIPPPNSFRILNNCVKIKSRLNNAEDLLMIVCANKALRNLKIKEIHLYTPYIMGLRSDRLFQLGGNRYIKDVLSPILNAQNFESVTCLDAHSYVAENCINNLENIDNKKLVCFALNEMKKSETTTIITPDDGASKKIFKLIDNLDYEVNIIVCSKDRDKDGKLTKTIVPDFDYSKDIVIIDDIFDFGGTFKNIAKAINEKIPESASKIGKKYLICTHAIQEEGLKDALKYFETIYTTNSYKDFNIERVKQLNVF